MAETDVKLKQRFYRRLESLKQQRLAFEPDWREIAGYCAPARSRFLALNANKGRRRNRSLNNSAGIVAMRTLQYGMQNGLSSHSRPWFAISLYNQDLLDDPEVKAWLDAVQKRMEAFLAHTNFYEASEVGYLELGTFGTDACVMLEHAKRGAVCHALTAGEYWIGLNDALEPSTLVRDSGMTVKQAIDTFGNDAPQRVRTLYDQSRYSDIVDCYHFIEPNDDHVSGRMGWQGKPWRSVWIDAYDDTIGDIIRTGGYEEQPFWAPRWMTTGADTYGQGPGHDALADLRELQMQAKRYSELLDLLAWPELVTTSKVKLKRQPKAVTSTDGLDATKMVSVPYEVPPQALTSVEQKIERLEGRIDEITFANLFMAITNMPGVQPRNNEEIQARNEEKMSQLGPVIERVNNEKLKVAIDRTFGIMQRRGLLPPAPNKLRQSPDIKIEFVSLLTQIQKMVGLNQIERGFQFVGGMSGLYPEAKFKLDPNAIIDEYTGRLGMPASLVRSNEDAQKLAAQAAQQAQMAQSAELAAKGGKGVKDLTQAATLAANMPVASTPAATTLEQPTQP